LEVQEEVTSTLNLRPDEWLLGQGTIYPDTIESGGTKHAAKIKTHHNRVEKIEKLIQAGKIIEPLKDLYKDEVREVGRTLGLPEKMISRHPFPGPGLGVRILCARGPDTLENAEKIETSIEGKFDGIEALILPLKSVGVQGDFRSYRHPVALFSDNEYDWNEFDTLAAKIPNTHSEINRVLLCLSHTYKLPAPDVVPSFMTSERIEILQEADSIIRHILETENFEGKKNIWQFPVVLCPLDFGGGESIILRPVESQEAMTASFAKIPKKVLCSMSEKILSTLKGKISAVFFDITNKPPGTIEWE
jgi:GMP synthase (glutamine-hydrolysing)